MITDSNQLMLDPRIEISFIQRFSTLIKDGKNGFIPVVLPKVCITGDAKLGHGLSIDGLDHLGIPLDEQDFDDLVKIGSFVNGVSFIGKDRLHLKDTWIIALDGIIGTICNELKLPATEIDCPLLGLFVTSPNGTHLIPAVKDVKEGAVVMISLPDTFILSDPSVLIVNTENAAEQRLVIESKSTCPYPFIYSAYRGECSASISSPKSRAFLLFHAKLQSPILSLSAQLKVSFGRLKYLLAIDFSSSGSTIGIILQNVSDVCSFDAFSGVDKYVYSALQGANASLPPALVVGFRLIKLQRLEVYSKNSETSEEYRLIQKSNDVLSWNDEFTNTCPYLCYLGFTWDNLVSLSKSFTLEDLYDSKWWGSPVKVNLENGARKEVRYTRFALVFFRKAIQFEILVERSPEAALDYLLIGDGVELHPRKLIDCFEKVLQNWTLLNSDHVAVIRSSIKLLLKLGEEYSVIKFLAKLAYLTENEVNFELLQVGPLVRKFGYQRLSHVLEKLVFKTSHAIKFYSWLLDNSLIVLTDNIRKKFPHWYKFINKKLTSEFIEEGLEFFSRISDNDCLSLAQLDYSKHASLFDRSAVKKVVSFKDSHSLKMFLNRLINDRIDWRNEHALLVLAGIQYGCQKKCFKFIDCQPEPLVVVGYLLSIGIANPTESWVKLVNHYYSSSKITEDETLAAFKFFKAADDLDSCKAIVKSYIKKGDFNNENFWILLGDIGDFELVEEYFVKHVDTHTIIEDHSSFRELLFSLLFQYGHQALAEKIVRAVFNQQDLICYYLNAILEKIDQRQYELWAYLILENVYDMSISRSLSLQLHKLFDIYFNDSLCRMLTECLAEKLSMEDLKAVLDCLVDRFSFVQEDDVLYPLLYSRYMHLKSLKLIKPSFQMEMKEAKFPDLEIESFLHSSQPVLELARFKNRTEAIEFIQDYFRKMDGFSGNRLLT